MQKPLPGLAAAKVPHWCPCRFVHWQSLSGHVGTSTFIEQNGSAGIPDLQPLTDSTYIDQGHAVGGRATLHTSIVSLDPFG